MKNTLFLVAAGFLLVVGAARAFTNLRPNCPVLGNWTDPEGTRQMWLSLTPHPAGDLVTEEMALNTSRTLIHHVLTRRANDSILGAPSTPLVYYPSNVTRPDGQQERESVVVQAKCVNDLLWVSVIPVSEESLYGHITSFTLRRQVLRALSEAPTPPPLATPNPHLPSGALAGSANPQFILVNVTLPQRQDDDNLYYMEDLLQKVDKDSDGSDTSSEATSEDRSLRHVVESSSDQDEQLEA